MIKGSFCLTEKQRDKLDKMAKDSGLKVAEIIRRILDGYFESKKEKDV